VDDARIVELYWDRSETAVVETQKKYGRYCFSIAYNILFSEQDAVECVNDAYINAWRSIPPHKPSCLRTFLGRLTRNISLNRYNRNRAQKRYANTELALDELAEVIPDPNSEAVESDNMVLKEAINGFLETLPKKTRIIFVRRYWYLSPIKNIADAFGLSESNVKSILFRTRSKFKAHLEKEGIVI